MAVCAPAHEAEDFDEVTAPHPKQRPLIRIKRVCVFYICVSAGGFLISFALDQDVQNISILINRAPQVMNASVDFKELRQGATGHQAAERVVASC